MKNYLVSYRHNNKATGTKWTYGGSVAQKRFESKNEAMKWIEENKQCTALKLMAWSDEIDSFETIKDFR